jgi:hypothetical protein
VFQGRVYGPAWGGADDLWVLHAADLYQLNWRTNQVLQRIPHGGSPGIQSIAAQNGGIYLNPEVEVQRTCR